MQALLSPLRRHGGRLHDARAAYPRAPRPWLDLSTGINPRGWHPPAPIMLDLRALPDVAALRQLEHRAAAFFGCDPARVAAVPGSEIALRLLPALGVPQPIVAATPSYGTHAEIAATCVHRDTLLHHVAPAGTLLLANPNNPDGVSHAPADLLALARRVAAAGGSLVIDEAFTDTDPSRSMIPHLDEAPVTVLRSFGKFFGLAGVRLGFVVGSPDTVAATRALTGDWPVGTQAIAWGTAAYADADWTKRTRDWLSEQAARLDAVLATHGLAATGECPLFRLVEHDDAPTIFDRLAHAGILTRPFAAHPRWLRFGLPGDEAALDRLDRALAGG